MPKHESINIRTTKDIKNKLDEIHKTLENSQSLTKEIPKGKLSKTQVLEWVIVNTWKNLKGL